MPDEAPEVIDLDDLDDPEPGPPPSPVVPSDAAIVDDPEPTAPIVDRMSAPAYPAPSSAIPPEPWFYRWLGQAAGFLWFLASASIVIAALVCGVIILVAGATDPGAILGALASAGIILGSTFVSLLPLAIGSALIRLAVDLARNVRVMRYR